MNTDDFEKNLECQALRQIPGNWRKEILRTARAAAPAPARRPSPLLLRAGLVLWRELIWPCRHAWCGLAALWIILLVINTRFGASLNFPTTMAAGVSAGTVQLFEEQRRALVELTGAFDLPPAETPHRPPPQPRSERILGIRIC